MNPVYIVLIILIVFFLLLIYYYFNGSKKANKNIDKHIDKKDTGNEENINSIMRDGNIMYELCDIKNKCGKDLVCENNRCKQKEGGPCSCNNDCSNEMFCVNWICTPNKIYSHKLTKKKRSNNKSVSWDNGL